MLKTAWQGSRYLELWPEHKILGAIFPEIRVKYVMRWGRRLIPPFIVFIILWNYVQGDGLKGVSFIYTQTSNWPLAVLSILFLLGIMFHGYYWAGRRSQLKLIGTLKEYYNSLCAKLSRPANPEPNLYELAETLKEGMKKIGPSILEGL